MTTVRVQSDVTEPIQAVVRDSSGALLTGLTDLFVRMRRNSDGFYFDWADDTFKSIGWTTRDQPLVEVDATLSPGLYEVTGGLDLSAITNVSADDNYTVSPLQTPGTDALLPAPGELKVGQWPDDLTDIKGATFTTSTDSLEAIRNQGDAAWLTATGFSVAGDAMALTTAAVDAVWDELQAGHVTPGSFGFFLDSQVSTAGSPAAIAAAVWAEDISGDSAKLNTAGGMLNVSRKAVTNNYALTPGVPNGTFILLDDDDSTPILSQLINDAVGGGVASPLLSPARRARSTI